MITPAVLISASGTLAVSTSNRLARVVDRVRTIAAEAEKSLHDGSERISQWRSVMGDQVSRLSERVMLLRGAMVCLYLAIGLLVLSSISIGLLSLFDWNLSWFPVVAGLAGAASLLKASLLLVKEANMAVASTLQEIEFIRLRMNI
jgi:hypothetical protein